MSDEVEPERRPNATAVWLRKLASEDRISSALLAAASEIDRILGLLDAAARAMETLGKHATRQTEEIERLRGAYRTLWLVVSTNDGYTIERADLEDYPGDDRAIMTQMVDEGGNVTLAASTRAEQI